MGDSNEPEAFMQNYNEAVTAYLMSTHREVGRPLTAFAPWTGNVAGVDAGTGRTLDSVAHAVKPNANAATTHKNLAPLKILVLGP